MLGIELNEHAAGLARVTVWIGQLQWRVQRGYPFKLDPVLEPLDHIECRDAVLAGDGQPAHWPSADAVVGNPPFVGDKKMRAELGDAYPPQPPARTLVAAHVHLDGQGQRPPLHPHHLARDLPFPRRPHPHRIVPRPDHEAALAKRTLTNLYNQRPTWLASAHATLDAAVAAAYGRADWMPEMPDDENLRRLLALNRARAGAT